MKAATLWDALLTAAPDYGSEGCVCGGDATPDPECPVHWAVAIAERFGLDRAQGESSWHEQAGAQARWVRESLARGHVEAAIQRIYSLARQVAELEEFADDVATGKYWTVDYQLREKAKEILKNSKEEK